MTLNEALRVLEPHLDAVICYASTFDEHPPNEAVKVIRDYLAHASRSDVTASEGEVSPGTNS